MAIAELCSTSEGLSVDILMFNEILKQNGYPNYFNNDQKVYLKKMIEGVQFEL